MKTLKQLLQKYNRGQTLFISEIIPVVEEWLKQFTLTIRTESDKILITEFINEELLYQLQMVEGKQS